MKEFLTGALGIVITPDLTTQNFSRTIAAEILKDQAQYTLSQNDRPHLTLYHGKLSSLPNKIASDLIEKLNELLVGKVFELNQLEIFGGNFLFWDIDWHSDKNNLLRQAHEMALSIAQYLDKTKEAKATSEEGLRLSDQELENVKNFGHPLVKQLFRPHITLGFGQGLAEKVDFKTQARRHSMTVSSVDLTEVGFPGRVERLVDLCAKG